MTTVYRNLDDIEADGGVCVIFSRNYYFDSSVFSFYSFLAEIVHYDLALVSIYFLLQTLSHIIINAKIMHIFVPLQQRSTENVQFSKTASAISFSQNYLRRD